MNKVIVESMSYSVYIYIYYFLFTLCKCMLFDLVCPAFSVY